MGTTITERMIGRVERVLWVREPAAGLAAVVALHSPRLGPALAGCAVLHGADSADAVLHAMRAAEWATLTARTAGAAAGGGAVVLLGDPHPEAAVALGDLLGDVAPGLWIVPDLGRATETGREIGLRAGRLADPDPARGAAGVVAATVSGWRQATGAASVRDVDVRVLGAGGLAAHVATGLSAGGARVTRRDVCDPSAPPADAVVACPGAGLSEAEAASLRCRLAVGAPGDALDAEPVWAALTARGVVAVPGSIAGGALLAAAAELAAAPAAACAA